jgi:predicted fused transcriptional regulator/phosphomethylpyrimidine kinase
MDKEHASVVIANLAETAAGLADDERAALNIAASLMRVKEPDCRCMFSLDYMTEQQRLAMATFGLCSYGVRMDAGETLTDADYVTEVVRRFHSSMAVILHGGPE